MFASSISSFLFFGMYIRIKFKLWKFKKLRSKIIKKFNYSFFIGYNIIMSIMDDKNKISIKYLKIEWILKFILNNKRNIISIWFNWLL